MDGENGSEFKNFPLAGPKILIFCVIGLAVRNHLDITSAQTFREFTVVSTKQHLEISRPPSLVFGADDIVLFLSLSQLLARNFRV